VNGTHITGNAYVYGPDLCVYVGVYGINFSLPAKVEVYHKLTRRHTMAVSVSARNTYIVENRGAGTIRRCC